MYEQLSIQTRQRIQFLDITDRVQTLLHRQRAETGVVTLFCPHTTAGITINENADPAVCRDLIETLSRLVPANQNYFTHMEGNSDAHVKSSLMGVSLQVLVENGRLALGTWQSIYFTEFDGPRNRQLWISFIPSSSDRWEKNPE